MLINGIISAARGERPVDILLKNTTVVNLLSGDIIQTNIAIYRGKIVGFGDYSAKQTIDVKGLYAAPGLIDGHVHLESSMLSPVEFSKAVIPMGTTTVIADPHEIVNVLGLAGLQYMLDATEYLPFDVYFMLPSCVPSTHLENAGAVVTAEDMRQWIDNPRVLGIGEMMNFPGVLFEDPQVLAKLAVAGEKRVDGHAPLVCGKDLSAYIAAGITSDHESTDLEEAREKLQKGMFLMIREGSAARNLQDLLPLVTPTNSRFCGFVTDDRHPDFLMDNGHINSMVKDAVKFGIDPIIALQMASLNTARHFGLKTKGAIAPGYQADLILFDNFDDFSIRMVYKNGKLVAEDGNLIDIDIVKIPDPTQSIQIKELTLDNLAIPAKGKKIVIIEIIPNQLLTKKTVCVASIVDGKAVSDSSRDILKMVVAERHHATGNIGLGFVKGIGLTSGAIASTVAHDSHNIIMVGVDDNDILRAIREIQAMNGGQVVVENGKVMASLPLPIAGLMSNRSLPEVRSAINQLNLETRRLGCKLENPFMTLSFLSLPVIPEIKLTDMGLVDVNKFDFIPLFADV
ncbi:MAG: adenine deaminase [Candidatus Marinimicrobia bacterium]|nr:adenine deaminase [Candidatus Neomarinimicrobiota bacterium]